MLAALAVGMVNNMAQEWWSDSEVVLPAQEARQGVVIPAKPKEPDLPSPTRATEKWRPATAEEKQRYGVDPARAYQINDAGEIKEVSGQPTAKPEAQPDTNRVPQINTGLNAVKDLRKISEQFLSVGKQAGRLADAPIIGGLIGQNRADLEGSLEILKGIIIQDQLARLAKINPAGIASLANTPAEQERFVSSIANLDPNQSPEQFAIGLKRAEDYLNRQLSEASGGQIQTADAPSAGGGEGGPAVTVTTEESIAEFGFPAYDKAGNLVGRAYAQSGADTVYDAQGNEVGIIRGVPEQTVEEPAPSFFGGIVRDIGEAVTGSERATATTEGLPDWVEMPEMQQLFSIPAFKAALGTAFGGGPKEIAQIVQSNFPGTEVFQDEKGNYILRSPSTGQRYAIKPGFQLSDVPRALSILLAGAGGRGAGVAQTAMREGALQAGIETTQAATGGTFNPEDIAAAAVLGGGGQKAAEVLPGVVQGVRNLRRGASPAQMAPQGAPELPGGLRLPGGGATPPPSSSAPMPSVAAAMAPAPAPVIPSVVEEAAAAPRVFEAGETVTSRAGGAMGTSPENVRLMQAEGLPVPIEMTRGAATRDPEQLAFEKEQLFSSLGGPLRKRAEENNLQALQNFDRFIDMTGAEAPDIAATGNAVIKALSQGYKASKNRVRAAYTKAEKAGETEQLVPYAPLVDYINGQTETTRTTLAPILQSTLEKLRMEDPNGTGQISIRALEDVRKAVNKAVQPGTPNAVYGGAIKDMIDQATDGVGGDLYREARRLRIEQANKFEKRAIVARLVSNIKNMDDRRVPADRVFQSAILNESPENIRFLRSTLRELGDDGKQAWGELQAATLRHIQDRATGNVNLTSENLPVISAAQLNKAVNELDKNGRLDLIFNPKMAQQVRDLRDVVQYINTVPPGTSVNNSGTARTLLTLLSESGATAWMTGGVPVPVITGIKLIRDQIKDAKIKKQINRSLLPRGERD